MSTLSEVLQAVKNAANVLEDVRRVGETLKDVSAELSDHDRRLHRLEAKWETMMDIAAIQGANVRGSRERQRFIEQDEES